MPTGLDEIGARLDDLRDPAADTTFQQKYVGTALPVLGLKLDVLHGIASELASGYKSNNAAGDWLQLLDALYGGPTFEHRVLAGLALHSLPAQRRVLELQRLKGWIANQHGWAVIDNTCQNGWTAKEVLARWEEWQPFLDALAADSNISLRRASLVLLNAPLRESPDPRLRDQALANVERLKGERDGLITKAVSWSLRTLIKHHAEVVGEYLEANGAALPKATVKEVRGKLETGLKG